MPLTVLSFYSKFSVCIATELHFYKSIGGLLIEILKHFGTSVCFGCNLPTSYLLTVLQNVTVKQKLSERFYGFLHGPSLESRLFCSTIVYFVVVSREHGMVFLETKLPPKKILQAFCCFLNAVSGCAPFPLFAEIKMLQCWLWSSFPAMMYFFFLCSALPELCVCNSVLGFF